MRSLPFFLFVGANCSHDLFLVFVLGAWLVYYAYASISGTGISKHVEKANKFTPTVSVSLSRENVIVNPASTVISMSKVS